MAGELDRVIVTAGAAPNRANGPTGRVSVGAREARSPSFLIEGNIIVVAIQVSMSS